MQSLQTAGKVMFVVEKNEKDPNLSNNLIKYFQIFNGMRLPSPTLFNPKLLLNLFLRKNPQKHFFFHSNLENGLKVG